METVAAFIADYKMFRAVRLEEDDESQPSMVKFGYALLGPQGERYYLMRVKSKPQYMLAMDMETKKKAPEFAGTLFSDQDGELVEV